MELIKAAPETCPQIKSLYRSAFPANERAPFWFLVRRANQGRADCWNLMDQSRWVGLAYAIPYQDLVYLLFFAVDEPLRGKGCGTRALQALRDHYSGRRLFLALEPEDPQAENASQRLKRHAFYLRCGLTDLPFMIREASVRYAVMGTDPVRPEEYQALVNNWLGYPLRLLVPMKIEQP